jgi:chemotaxis protein CheD
MLSSKPERKRTAVLPQPAVVDGFEHITRYFDAGNHRFAAKLLPGQYYLSRDETIVAVLGTGVAVCIRDRAQGLGGVAHVLEPQTPQGTGSSLALPALRTLLEALLAAGAQRGQLEAKLFGGACPRGETGAGGARSLALARAFLREAGVPIVAEDVGGGYPRKIDYCPADGRARIKRLRDLRNATIAERDQSFLGQSADGLPTPRYCQPSRQE